MFAATVVNVPLLRSKDELLSLYLLSVGPSRLPHSSEREREKLRKSFVRPTLHVRPAPPVKCDSHVRPPSVTVKVKSGDFIPSLIAQFLGEGREKKRRGKYLK
ncbi:hypothetical protein F2P81_008335 [Scophthalmus maximus]|uniref:Uncharacterized protein n=1 Tax=Scophthalmus maximus TaxID=52904 RepID=A0A6A4T7Z0_SCOMX|nr:hypothetical protein F2P81_008335 [Scophthalmus maximus]